MPNGLTGKSRATRRNAISRLEFKLFALLTGLVAAALVSITIAMNARAWLVSVPIALVALAMFVAIGAVILRDV